MNGDKRQARAAAMSGDWRTFLLVVLAFAAAFWLARETMAITMPVITALLLALGVWPMVEGISRRMPRGLKWVGSLVGLLVVLTLLLAFLAALGIAARQTFELVGNVGPALERWLDSLGVPEPSWSEMRGSGNGSPVPTAMRALGLTASTLTAIVLILFLMLLMLTEADNWHRKFTAVSQDNSDRDLREIARSVGQKFRTYFITRVLLGAITAALYVGWLMMFGVDYLLLWGLLAVLLNFIPTVGSIIAGLLPVAYVVVQRDAGTAAIVGTGILVIEQVMGNLVDPLVLGRRIAISPLVVLVSLGFWSIVWGIPGAILAVPLTFLIILVMAHFEALKPAALLLTDKTSFEELEKYRHSG
ncbi:MAG: AI-2E family transporter [Phycisphaerae bacterium]|nr:AI-2E family transporter [Phycisphaerae bacterium]